MRILLLGATGYLGSNLVECLLKKQYKVTILKRAESTMTRIIKFLNQVDILEYSINDLTVFDLHNYDMLINCIVSYGRRGESDTEVAYVNNILPLRFLESAVCHKVPFFLNMTTAINSNLNAYVFSKKKFSEWGSYYAQSGKICFLNCLLEHFYGPFEQKDIKFVSSMIHRLHSNEPQIELTKGEQLRDFIYIDDVMDAILAIVGNIDTFNSYSNVSIGSGVAIKIKELVCNIKLQLNSSSNLCFGAIPYRENEVMYSCANTEKLMQLGWVYKTSIFEGIKKIIDAEKL